MKTARIDYKVGDWVVCITNRYYPYLIEDKIYQVKSIKIEEDITWLGIESTEAANKLDDTILVGTQPNWSHRLFKPANKHEIAYATFPNRLEDIIK